MTDSTRRSIKSAKERRTALIQALGGSCPCGITEKLELHHKAGTRTWKANKLSRWIRIKKYEDDHKAGYLSLLCHECHKKAA